IRAARDAINKDFSYGKGGGHMYEVAIHARPHEFLDWDAPLSQQPHVLNAIDRHIGDPSIVLDQLSLDPNKSTGSDFHDAIGGKRKAEAVAQKLASMGFAGIRYLDRDSRSTGEGTRNYVVFHPKHLEIKRRYADGGAVDPFLSNAVPIEGVNGASYTSQADLDNRIQQAALGQGYADGGQVPQMNVGDDPTVQRALDVAREYQDPPTKHIDDWTWKSLSDVQNRLGNFREIPSHVQAFGSYMDEIAKRAANEGLSARDLIKAYTITRASIQRRANDVDRVRAAGLDLPKSFTGKIRPEGAFGEWLHTRAGQDYLNSAERGEVNEDAIANAVKIMTPFGKHEKDIPDALRWAANNLPGKEQEISTLVANAMRGASEPAEWRAMAKDVRGVGPSKAGFLASLMGRGDQPTLDARQIIEHTGRPTSEAQAYLRRKGGEGATEAVERLSARQQAMDLQLPEELKPYYQHLAHHAVWDKAANEVTTHEDVMNAMRGAAHGGEIDEASILSHPVVHALRLAGLPKLGDLRRADGGGIDDPTVQKALRLTAKNRPMVALADLFQRQLRGRPPS
ncbi:MAG: hypothetical protein EBS87_10985, partial [Sphingomonadaceae bacterium]|nr:hypothetical protein [Sphingomonadaceae bacterium]